jgi:hypothetical protein
MIKKLFTFGCSFTRDNYQKTWADLLAEKFDLELHNYAERGCGANYISKRVLTSNNMDHRDSVAVVMWPCADRFDLWVDDTVPHLLNDIDKASWPNGKSPMFVDLNGYCSKSRGYILNGSIPRGYKHYYFKYFYSPYQTVHDWYTSIIQTQLYFKSMRIKCIMVSAWPLTCPLQYHIGQFDVDKNIFDKIDLDMFIDTSLNLGFYNYCKLNNLEFFECGKRFSKFKTFIFI